MIVRKMERLSLTVFKVYSISPKRSRKSSVSSIPGMAWSGTHNLDNPIGHSFSPAEYSTLHNRILLRYKFYSRTDNFTLREKRRTWFLTIGKFNTEKV
jgi:hypothetical protein